MTTSSHGVVVVEEEEKKEEEKEEEEIITVVVEITANILFDFRSSVLRAYSLLGVERVVKTTIWSAGGSNPGELYVWQAYYSQQITFPGTSMPIIVCIC